MWSQTRRALRADVRTYLAWARTTGASPGAYSTRGAARLRLLLGLGGPAGASGGAASPPPAARVVSPSSRGLGLRGLVRRLGDGLLGGGLGRLAARARRGFFSTSARRARRRRLGGSLVRDDRLGLLGRLGLRLELLGRLLVGHRQRTFPEPAWPR